MGALFNASLTIMIVATMFVAGLSTTLQALGSVFKNVLLVVLVLITALVLRPLLGWGLAEVFGLATAPFIVMVLLGASPGAPLGAKFVMSARGDLTTGASLQVLLAAIGSVTFPLTASFILGAADLGAEFSIPVGDLMKTIVVLQIVPFVVGIAVRHWTADTAAKWKPSVQQVANVTLMITLVLALLGSWEAIINVFGEFALLAQALFVIIIIAAGWFLSTGDKPTRKATALIEPCSNSGPVFAAVAIAFDNDPEILGILVALLVTQIIIAAVVGSYLGKEEGEGADTGTSVEAAG
jgi:BASS family bile acid:Na+ symporter